MKGLILSTLIGCALSLSWNDELTLTQLESLHFRNEWLSWKSNFGKNYPDLDEELHRYGLWLKNLYVIADSNSQDLTYKLRMNQFGDMTNDEFSDYASCLSARDVIDNNQQQNNDDGILGANGHGIYYKENPSSVDWTTQGVVTPVKNQGNCGSCWSFSATGAMECDYAIKTGTLNSLSEQQLVDCSGAYGNEGCNGGWYYDAWEYVHHVGGLCTEDAYPYTARNGECKASTCGTFYNDVTAGIDTKITADSDTALETAAAQGCVSVAIQADQTAFQYYSSGVLTGNCGTRIDHAVLVVGYGTESGQEYWKVKNSWGVTWGEQGYVLICRNCDKNGNKGECGINMYPYVPDY